MSLKDNFNQAVKEILKKDGLVGDNLAKGSKGPTEIDKFLKDSGSVPGSITESLTPGPSTSEGAVPDGYGTSYSDSLQERIPSAEDFKQSVHNPHTADPLEEPDDTEASSEPEKVQDYGKFEYTTDSENDIYNAPPQSSARTVPPPPQTAPFGGMQGSYGGYGSYGYGGAGIPPRGGAAASALRGGRPPETPYYETEETTVISRNTKINGDISSFANVNVEGSVQGDIKLTKNISLSGKVVGNIECNNAVMAGAQMQGSISSKGQVQMDHDSVLLGNIDTQYLDLNGRIKGSVDVGGKAEFKNDAVIVGDITASTISVIDGAVIKGFVNTTFMQESTSNVFPEAITVGE